MKRKIKIKKLGVLILILVLIPILTIVYLMNKSLSKEPVNVDYTTDSIINETLPVVNTKETIMYPYNDSSVTIGKSYYDYLSDASSQENSIILRDDTYIQNTGIDYVSENTFEVLSILEGTVISVKEDDNVGKTVEIKHSNNYISIYQSLSEVSVKKGDIVQSNQVIGISGTNELDKDLGNHLHFELYIKGQSVNPELYLNKEVNINEE